ncbi:MAG: Nif3-like dinuclear metal center hexameric protein [Ruminococcus sp.]|nr:Nif3-like dinuclear metal center hexameric protein [Ruminococcus sp.]
MTSIRKIEEFCKQIAPYELADEWDNVGLLVGAENDEVDKVLLALDITPAAVEEAHNIGAGLIISHHPVIFEPLRYLTPDNAVYALAKYGIGGLCLHTNLDRAQQGVNTQLAKALGLKNTAFYPEDYLLIGEPECEMTAEEFAAFVKEKLGAPSVRFTDGKVTKVAVSSGGGGGGIELSKECGFDAFVTGEMKHHQYLWANTHGIAAFDAGHFSTENVVIGPLREMLEKAFPKTDFIVSGQDCPYRSV